MGRSVTLTLRARLPGLVVPVATSAVILAIRGSQLIHLIECAVLAALSLWWAFRCLGRPTARDRSTLGYLTPPLLCSGATALFGVELASVLIKQIQFFAPHGAVHAP